MKAHQPKKQDKYYTDRTKALQCITEVFQRYPCESFSTIIDPGAGNGSFFTQIEHNNIDAIDIIPEHERIQRMDFLDYFPRLNDMNALTIGNPPFGERCSLLIKFFNHSAKFSRVIAFIVPALL